MTKEQENIKKNEKVVRLDWVIYHVFLSSADLYVKINFEKFFQRVKQFGSRIGTLLDGSNLGSNCLQILEADDTSKELSPIKCLLNGIDLEMAI